ncbi:DUF3152 domain-containing protein [Streptomyces sp. NPDC006197]|uniref:DUF3152 domain-containing protein n=1 Tax=Streptomyces sp. NPDC006197 TaxID=3156685 RepID=UPI0033A77502
MGRHSRKGSAPSVADTGQQAGAGTGTGPGASPAGPPPGTGRRRRTTTTAGGGQDTTGPQGYGTPAHGTPMYGTPAQGTPQYGTPTQGAPRQGAPVQGAPRHGTPAHGTPQYGTPGQGAPRPGAPAQGAPRHGTPAHGTPQYGAPAQGAPGRGAAGYGGPRHATPAHGTPAYPGAPGTPAHGVPAYGAAVRGGHPQHDETSAPRPASYGPRGATARAAAPEQDAAEASFVPAPRREVADGSPDPEAPASRGGLGRALAGIAAAAVATVLAVVVTGQVTGRGESPAAAHAAGKPAERPADDTSASRSDDRPVPAKPAPAAAPPTYEQLMTRQFPIDPKLKGSGEFEAVPGLAKAPGKGRLIRYRVDVEKGIGLDPKLFADAVQKTLNDKRSWAGRGEMTFERISSGEPEFVITLASPGTTGAWCAKSGLDTTVDNVSCDSASTQRVMINAFRWAKGSDTFGPKAMHAYRQMLINHEVGHRLGHGHVNCSTPGALAPVMQQQTKSLDIDGIKCRPNPWVYPAS